MTEQVETKANALRLFLDNESDLQPRAVSAFRQLRQTFDTAAGRLAKANAEWHDDPSHEDHTAYHAPADVQFPRAARDAAIREFIEYWLSEQTIQEGGAA